MGKRRKKPRGSGRGSGTKGSRRRDSAHSLQEAKRRARHGQVDRAVRLAREAVATAGSPAQRREAQRALGEALLLAALARDTAAEALNSLEHGLREDPGSSRLSFYRALARLQLGRTEEGRESLVRSLAGDALELPLGREHALQLASLASGRRVDTDDLTEEEAVELGHVQGLLDALEGRRGETFAPVQTNLFPSGTAGEGRGTDDRAPLSDPRMWQALRELVEDPEAAPLERLSAAGETVPQSARALVRYYEGVVELRRGRRDEALEPIRSAFLEGWDSPWLRHNLVLLLRGQARTLAEEERWTDLADWAERLPPGLDDGIVAETVALALDHLAYRAARAGRWPAAAALWRRAESLAPRRAVARNLALAEEALENWRAAAEAWRAMARRRPRSPDHEDYLPDDQVAALWAHAAECYGRAGEVEDGWEAWESVLGEALTCLDTALKYAPDDTAIRFERADLLLARESEDAAATELDRVLELDPRHLRALRLRAALEGQRPGGDPAPLLRRALELAPRDPEIREALASTHMRRAVPRGGIFGMSKAPRAREAIRTLKEGLDEVPGHAGLLVALGRAYRIAGKRPDALATLEQALRGAAGDPDVAGDALHELVHAASRKDEERIEAAMAHVGDMDGLLPAFWIDEAARILECGLPPAWFHRFLESALALADRPGVPDSRASVLFRAWNSADEVEGAAVSREMEARIREEEPSSGAAEIIDAERLLLEDDDVTGARRLLREAARKARRAGDEILLRIIDQREAITVMPGNLLRIFEGLLP